MATDYKARSRWGFLLGFSRMPCPIAYLANLPTHKKQEFSLCSIHPQETGLVLSSCRYCIAGCMTCADTDEPGFLEVGLPIKIISSIYGSCQQKFEQLTNQPVKLGTMMDCQFSHRTMQLRSLNRVLPILNWNYTLFSSVCYHFKETLMHCTPVQEYIDTTTLIWCHRTPYTEQLLINLLIRKARMAGKTSKTIRKAVRNDG